MPIVTETLLNFPIPEIRQRLRWQDSALYALSLGCGQNPMDEPANTRSMSSFVSTIVPTWGWMTARTPNSAASASSSVRCRKSVFH